MKQKYELQTLTPVHIGTGNKFNHIDGYFENGRWYRIDLDKVLARLGNDIPKIDRLTNQMGQGNFRWGVYFKNNGLKPAEMSTYSLPCSQAPKEDEIQEAIATVGNRPYIPGSTLKGAIRTMLALGILTNQEDSLDKERKQKYENSKKVLNSKSAQPAGEIENIVFGKDPHHDLLRALQVSDTEPLPSDCLEIGVAKTVTLRGNTLQPKNYNSFVQQIKPGQRLTFTLKIDEALFGEQAKRRLGFTGLQERSLMEISEICWRETDTLMKKEQKFFRQYQIGRLSEYYGKLIRFNDNLPEGTYLLQIGWGTGYNAQTITSQFTKDINLRDLRERFGLGKLSVDVFPKTRRVYYDSKGDPVSPFGWVKISPID